MNYNTAKLRQFIQEYFSSEELRTLLFDYFRPVHDNLTDGMTKNQYVLLLLEYCRNHGKMPDLLAAIQRERDFFQPDDYVQGQKLLVASPPTPAPITRNPRQIFISHAHQDAEVAQKLAYDLEAHGYDIWIAPDSIRPGEKWIEAINRGLEESGIFVLLLSPDAVASRWVQIETNVAISLNRQDKMQLYPLLLKTCRPPILWQAFQYISFISNYVRGFDQLLAVLNPDELGFLIGQSNQLSAEVKDTSVEEPEEIGKYVRSVRENVRKNLKKITRPEADEDIWIHPKSGLEMVHIPAGEFLYGDDKKKLYLDEFWIAKTPVTNAQYKRFLDANPNYDVPYIDPDLTRPYNWDIQRRTYPADKSDHPVVLVNWYDAEAFAAWAGLSMPTEEEWEKAARGPDGRKYPWDGEWRENHCNTREASINATSPVGQFSPQGDSVYGCQDMSGNVWEWVYLPLQVMLDYNVDRSALRGGSWTSPLIEARVVFSFNRRSGLKVRDIGFRVVMRHAEATGNISEFDDFILD